jgi:hypothetical protein
MINRSIESELLAALARFPAVALIGPRQVGKTTLARKIAAGRPDTLYLDLERPSDLARVQEPELLLAPRCEQLVVIDEVQNAADLFPVLRALIDEHRVAGRFLLLGSASPVLINTSAESLAGRIRYLEMTPLTLAEIDVTPGSLRQLWLRGGFPDAYAAATDADSFEWREAFVRTYIERDIASGKCWPTGTARYGMPAHWRKVSMPRRKPRTAIWICSAGPLWRDACRRLPPISASG